MCLDASQGRKNKSIRPGRSQSVCGSPKFGAAAGNWTRDHPNRKKNLRLVRESERSSTQEGGGYGVLCAQPVSVRNQQAGPDPELPTGLHEMESERIHPALYLVRERAENQTNVYHDELCTRVRIGAAWTHQIKYGPSIAVLR